ncbi:BREX-1 system phosphatase PglZ type A [Schleiferilactobacillus shenzhenensis]|uniref:Uncharacterized protein n=1 Tax=Schleiferilactobacillus shenzhenensis LY-73 TaxID=1231336 RepID=U4TPP8_9LACO|nr:BREX-1 system phosphatase PglZ type A [Schleiferilactobacillus shenzhenensis]ERL63853.1 hypothetical protein L248_2087 [Schleiferilactobacillus shenzhenensis LY-73]
MAELDTEKIVAGIEKLFANDNHFVFWYDAKGEFTDNIPEITEKLREPVVTFGPREQFKTKVTLVEMEKKHQSALVYLPYPKPDLMENFLTDMLYYSPEYIADATVMLQQELGVPDWDTDTFKQYEKFFASKERQTRFRKVYEPGKDLPMAIMAAVTKADNATMTMVLRAVLTGGLTNDNNSALADLAKYGLADQFWENVRAAYGFQGAKNSLKQLATAFYLNYAYYQMEKDVPQSLANYQLGSINNAVTFLSLARNDMTYAATYRAEAKEVWDYIDGGKLFRKADVADLVQSDVFPQFDRTILTWATGRLMAADYHAPAGQLTLTDVLAKRRTMYFHDGFGAAYAMLQAAVAVLAYQGTTAEDLAEATKQYVDHDYAVDTAYRHFVAIHDQLTVELSGVFDDLVDRVDNTYVNDFLNPKIVNWTGVYRPAEIARQDWQRNFYSTYLGPVKERWVVIISDAFRYEAAKELEKQLAAQDVYSTEMKTVYSGLPSVTYFGMPALLPHTQLTYQTDHTVLIDGTAANSTETREQVLKTKNPQSAATIIPTFLSTWNTAERKAFLADEQVVYLYHNQVDAAGDHAVEETSVFERTADTIETLSRTIAILRNLSVSHIIVTADHGYVYKRAVLDSADKIDLGDHDFDTRGQRYAISADTIEGPGIRSQRLGDLLANDDDRRVYYPATDSIFVSAGAGQNYVHGGASPQEMIVPVLKVNLKQGKSKAEPVMIKVTNAEHRITSRSISVPISQEPAVSDTATPATYLLYFVDDNDRIISNEVKYVADSTDPDTDKRRDQVYMTLSDQPFDNAARYYLVIRNAETDEKVARIQYRMDLTIGGGIGFDLG